LDSAALNKTAVFLLPVFRASLNGKVRSHL